MPRKPDPKKFLTDPKAIADELCGLEGMHNIPHGEALDFFAKKIPGLSAGRNNGQRR